MSDDIALEFPEGLSDNAIKSVVGLAREQWQLEAKVASLERQLKETREALANVAERELPNLMVELGIEGLPLAGGVQLKLATEVYASINKDSQSAAHDWLEANGHEDLIKREFTIRFDRQDETWAKKFQRDLDKRKRPLAVKVKRAVHPQTLNAWVRESLLAGVTLPEDVFGVFRKRIAKLLRPKGEAVP